jgi:uncharacterized protein DUF4397
MRMKAIDLFCAGLVAAALGCGDSNKSANGPVVAGPTTSAPPDLGAAPTPPLQTALLRVVHLTPDAPAVDICYAMHGSTDFQGPLLKTAGVSKTGVAYTQATKYLPLPQALYDVRVVDGAATSCANGLLDVTNLPALLGNENVTLAVLGLMHPPTGNNNTFALKAYVDDNGVAPGPVALRFIHASPDTPAVDTGGGSGNQFAPMFLNVTFGDVGGNATGNHGYVMIPPPQEAPLWTVRLRGATDDALTFTPPMAWSRGDTVTAFLIGDLRGAPAPLKALVCVDNAAPTAGFAACAVRP